MKRFLLFITALNIIMFMTLNVAAAAPSDEHVYKLIESKSKEPTCTTDGYHYYQCVNHASVSYYESISKKNHEYIETVTRAPSCKLEGEITYTCIRGDHKYTKSTQKLQHNYEQKFVKPTCETDGRVISVCRDCGEESEKQGSLALGHNFSERIVKAPNCAQSGIKEISCLVCGYSYNELIPAKSHEYQRINSDSTNCGKGVEVIYECSECKISFSQYDNQNSNHDYLVRSTKQPTENAEGFRELYCKNCGESKIEILPSLHIEITGNISSPDEGGNINGKDNYNNVENGYSAKDTLPEEIKDSKITFKNTASYILLFFSAVCAGLFGVSIVSDFRVLKWYKKLKDTKING